MIIETNDSSMPFAFAYSEQEWAAVVATLPNPLADAADLDAERKELESVATAYLNLTHHHRIRSANGFPTKRWKKKREQIANDLAKAERTGNVDQVCVLREEFRHADVAVAGFALLGEAHQRRGNPARVWFFDAALVTWRRLGGKMGITRAEYGRGKPERPDDHVHASCAGSSDGRQCTGRRGHQEAHQAHQEEEAAAPHSRFYRSAAIGRYPSARIRSANLKVPFQNLKVPFRNHWPEAVDACSRSPRNSFIAGDQRWTTSRS